MVGDGLFRRVEGDGATIEDGVAKRTFLCAQASADTSVNLHISNHTIRHGFHGDIHANAWCRITIEQDINTAWCCLCTLRGCCLGIY
jgi:hypothetical protein